MSPQATSEVTTTIDEEVRLGVGNVEYVLIPNKDSFVKFDHVDDNNNPEPILFLVYPTKEGQTISQETLYKFRAKVLDHDDVFQPAFSNYVVFYGSSEQTLRIAPDAYEELAKWNTRKTIFVEGDSSRQVPPGAIIVGKVKLQVMIVREEPVEAVEFTDPFNPRGDGYQVPSGSSSGSANAIGSYDWLDLCLGSDTNGSVRKPAHYNGCHTIRPTTGIMNTDGVVGFSP
ncbi:amidase signature domain-containing protein [Camillea tinctor]|nr:amidase signature domain-containing protein [Camillea tinctor]